MTEYLCFEINSHNYTYNITVRRGVFWSLQNYIEMQHNNVLKVVPIKTKVIRFKDITNNDIKLHHNSSCRIVSELYKTLCQKYDDFSDTEIVTIIHYELEKGVVK